MIQYEKVSNPLSIHFESDDLDLLQVGILNSSLHKILNQVAIALLSEENKNLEKIGQDKILDHIPQTLSRDDVLIRARIISVNQGSIKFDIVPLLAMIFSQAGAAAILQNLISNVIWAIGTYGLKVPGCKIIRQQSLSDEKLQVPNTSAKRRIRPIVVQLVNHLKEASNGGKITLRSGDEELTVEFYPPNHQAINTQNRPESDS